MAGHWRIRHKLMLGLGLVVAVVGILLAGTLFGLNSYRTTVRRMDHRLVDLKHATLLQQAISNLERPSTHYSDEAGELVDKVAAARTRLADYERALKDNHTYGLSSDKSHMQTGQIPALEKCIDRLEQAIDRAVNNSGPRQGPSERIIDTDEFKTALRALRKTTEDLHDIIYSDSYERIKDAKEDHLLTMWVVVTTAVVGLLLMAGLLRVLYRWWLHPLQELQRGVDRVAQGNFDHTITIHSGDEIQDLAAAFNEMTTRLRDMYRDLARQVNERSRQLVRSERLAGVGFLAAGVAHEINNPLASIAFCSEALERRLEEVLAFRTRAAGASEDVEVITKYLRMIQQEAFRCKEITQRLLEFSRGGERKRAQTDLGELIQSVLEVVQHLQNCRGKELIFKPTYRVVAWVNAQEIKSVVLNLIVNALDSMEEGGQLTISLGRRDGNAELVFKDTGCGMTAEVLENIFEPFFTRSRTGKGTGLGLSISHRIISQHGGAIEAVSDGQHQGSTFTVALPLQPAEEQGQPQQADSEPAGTRMERRAA